MRVNAGMAAREDIVSLSDRIHNPDRGMRTPFITAGIAAILGLAIGVGARVEQRLTDLDLMATTGIPEVPELAIDQCRAAS